MYFDENWTSFSLEDLAKLCNSIGPRVGDKHVVDSKTTVADQRKLSFYNSVYLIRVKDRAWEPKNLFLYYLAHGTDLLWLNGTSPPIHQLNARGVLNLTDTNVLDYLRFFCFYVRAEEGPFVVAEDMKDTYVPKDIDKATRKVLENTLRPARNEECNSDGNWNCDAVVYYSNAIFSADYLVESSGMVHMLADQPIAADLPVKIDAPIA